MPRRAPLASPPSPHPIPETPDHAEQIRSGLLTWYAEAQRDLPWRRHPDPYAVWISEVMLQQTQVITVLPYFARWMARFPSLPALAEASEDAVLSLWQGLGYYSRARSLLAGAQAVMDRHRGQIPEDVDQLLQLPGIGRYTAGAISSIAYGHPAPIVDGNIKRVFCRLFALHGDPSRAPLDGQLWAIAEALVPAKGARDHNQSLMELGATVCTPRSPRCEVCPLQLHCEAFAQGQTHALPEARARAQVTKILAVAALCVRRDRIWVMKLPSSAPRWGGLWQFPTVELDPREPSETAVKRLLSTLGARSVTLGEALGRVVHTVTRFRIELQVHRCVVASIRTARTDPTEAAPVTAWHPIDELHTLPMPSAQRRIANHLQRHGLCPMGPTDSASPKARASRSQTLAPPKIKGAR